MFPSSTAGAVFPFSDDKGRSGGVNRNSAVIGGETKCPVLGGVGGWEEEWEEWEG